MRTPTAAARGVKLRTRQILTAAAVLAVVTWLTWWIGLASWHGPLNLSVWAWPQAAVLFALAALVAGSDGFAGGGWVAGAASRRAAASLRSWRCPPSMTAGLQDALVDPRRWLALPFAYPLTGVPRLARLPRVPHTQVLRQST